MLRRILCYMVMSKTRYAEIKHRINKGAENGDGASEHEYKR
jgi:hypothetical protein